MMLSDTSIRERELQGDICIVPPPMPQARQPASIDLRLGMWFRSPYVDAVDSSMHPEFYTIMPDECVLACTVETIRVGVDLVGRVEGKSTWGRQFLMVHSTAGFIDPGFQGTITLELKNLSRVSLTLPVGGPIAQISFQMLDRPAARPYGSNGLNSRYQGQSGVTAARA